MQFPNPIARYLIISDSSGNTVISIGPGPYIKIINPTSGAELDMDAGTTYPELVFWNSGHTSFGKISLDVSPYSGNQMLKFYSPSEPGIGLPGQPNVQPRMLMTSAMIMGDVYPGTDNQVGGSIYTDEIGFALSRFNAASVVRQYIQTVPGSDDLVLAVPGPGDIIFAETSTNTGFGLEGGSQELRAYNGGTFLDWVALTLQNGWTAKASYYVPAYRFTPDGRIELRGTMTGGTTADGTVIALMPFVPARLDLGDPHISNGGSTNKRLFYNTDGKLYCYGVVGATDLSINGNRFSYK